jgi:WD40 repeat protein
MMLLTCGNDRLTKLWDLRNLSTPVKVLAGHTHWVTSALYNPNHDQLILTGGSDAAVNLWRIASCSSSPWVTTADCDESEDPADVKVQYNRSQYYFYVHS